MNLRHAIIPVALGAATWWGISAVAPAPRGPAPSRDRPAGAPTAVVPPTDVTPAPPTDAPPPRPLDEVRRRLLHASSQLRDPRERDAYVHRAVRGVPRALFARLIESLAGAPDNSVETELRRALVLRWAWEEPMNVAEWAVDQPDGVHRREALAIAAQAWARLDPGPLLQWATELPAADREWVLLRSGDFLGRTDPALFAVWLRAIQPGRERDRLQLEIAREWANRDPAVLAAALREHVGPEYEEWRQLTVAGLATRVAGMNGAEAVRFVTEEIPPGAEQAQAAKAAVVAWAREDPARASQWIDRFPGEELRSQAAQILLGHWLQSDAAAAQVYARSLPAGVLADGAHERVAQHLAERDGRDAMAWAERIADPVRRGDAVAFVLAEWSRRDPAGYAQLLRQRPELSRPLPGSGD
ncbi:MAG TPA: hypothetical protein VEB66_00665 [Opitutaceae bacterium]|nr:hypothetical protein [Opitutaceae bacterium]